MHLLEYDDDASYVHLYAPFHARMHSFQYLYSQLAIQHNARPHKILLFQNKIINH